jgi:hypothetical protein
MTGSSSSTAYELQTNRTTYRTVFNSWAAQINKFEFRIQIQTKGHNWFEPRV